MFLVTEGLCFGHKKRVGSCRPVAFTSKRPPTTKGETKALDRMNLWEAVPKISSQHSGLSAGPTGCKNGTSNGSSLDKVPRTWQFANSAKETTT